MRDGGSQPIPVPELIAEVFMHLDIEDVILAGRVCKEWYAVYTSSHLWKRLYEKRINKG